MDLNKLFVDSEDDIVISGISGRFPESDSIDELMSNLFANKDLITEDSRRWPMGLYGLPTRSGKLKELNKFDAQFFGLSGKQADYMDPQGRILLETTYEAIVDSGWNPTALRGSNTAVYIGAFLTETEESLGSDPNKVLGYAATGTKRNMLANRISFVFDLKGPSLSLDTACSSSLVALQLAYSGLRSNEFEMAIVAGAHINLRPASALEFQKLGILSIDGKSKFLDESANGYARCEAVVTLFLQKRKFAKRVYATIVHTKTNSDGNKVQGITYPSSVWQINLMEATLKESKVDPNWIGYVEAHGTGTQAGDQNESKAIYEVFCKNRSDPLLVGSVKSNLGHSEPSSGVCSVAKVITVFESQKIPASLHLNKKNPLIKPLIDGSIAPVVKNIDFEDSVVAINSFGFGGTNAHLLLRPNHSSRSEERVDKSIEIPRLIVVNGRTEDSVNHILDFIRNNPNKANEDFLSLLNDVTTDYDSVGMDCRGFMVREVCDKQFVELDRNISKVENKRQVWFILSGMGTQWTAMAKGLMDIDVINKSLNKSAQFLKPYGIDLLKHILGEEDELLSPILYSTVGMASIQIALVDLMRALDIKPDGFLGHSSGEVCCAYLDGVLDHREMILYTYWRGKCSTDGQLPNGLMAAVGLTWDEALKRCPPGVVPACHNAPDSVTISGAFEDVNRFLDELKAENIFTKKVNSSNIAFHSPYMDTIAPLFLEKLRSVSNAKRMRSNRWISTSIPESEWSTPEAQYSKPEYYVNNVVKAVLFQEALQYVPRDAIVVEISPDSLFRNIVKKSIGSEASYVGLMKRNNGPNNVSHLLSSIGHLFNLGLNPKIQNLYPKITYPVKRGTQSLGSLIDWDHEENYLVTLYPEYFCTESQSEISIEIDFNKPENQFYFDHCIDGRPLFPATGYLYLVWREFARQLSTTSDELPVVFENIHFLRATFIAENTVLVFKLNISKLNGDFNLYQDALLIVTGRIYTPQQLENNKFLPLRQKISGQLTDDCKVGNNTSYQLDRRDVYKELYIRGYHYGKQFQQILTVDPDKSRAKIKFSKSNWITFSDAMLHFMALNTCTRDLLLPTSISSLHCDPKILATNITKEYFEVCMDLTGNYCLADGLEVYGLVGTKAVRRNQSQELVLEKYTFVPYMDSNALQEDMRELVDTYISLINELISNISINKPLNDKNILLNRFNTLLAINGLTTDKLVLKYILDKIKCNGNTVGNAIKQLESSEDPILCTDLLNSLYLDESLLRPAVDIVLENNCKLTKEFNVLEINFNQAICYQQIMNYLKDSFYNLRIKYSVYNPTDIGLEQESDTFDKINIDFTLNSTTKSDKSKLDLVIIREKFPTKVDANGETNVSHERILEYIYANLELNGFLLILKRNEYTTQEKIVFKQFGYSYNEIPDNNHLMSIVKKMGFSLISYRSDSMTTSSVILFRKVSTNNYKSNDGIFIRINHSEYESWFEKLKTELKSEANDQQLIWLISDEEDISGIIGFVNCLRREPGGHRIRCVSNLMSEDLNSSLSLSEQIDTRIFDKSLVMNIYKNNEFGSYRYFTLNSERMTKSLVRHAMISKDYSMFQWLESPDSLWPNSISDKSREENILINVYFAGVNPTDLSNKSTAVNTNRLSIDERIGLCSEFSGSDDSGNKYFGLKTNSCLSTTLAFNANTDYIPVPNKWSLEQACSVPMAYGTGYLALVIRAQLHKNQSVLILAADGYVGRAATAICLSYGCEVFATVGSLKVKNALLTEYSDLDESKVIDTSFDSFKEVIIKNTFGKGVDIVFNYTNDYNTESTIGCLKQNGRLLVVDNEIEIMKAINNDKNITIDRISLNQLFKEDTTESMAELRNAILLLIQKGMDSNVVKPFESIVFTVDNVGQALDYVSHNGHNNKVLVKIRDEEQEYMDKELNNFVEIGVNCNNRDLFVNAVHNTMFRKDKSYIITGGLGGFGLELAHWMAERGAGYLMLTSRNGVKTSLQHFNVQRLKSLGANVFVSQLDASIEQDCNELLKEVRGLAPIGGIFSLAMVLSDGLFANQSPEAMRRVLAPKALALRNLDLMSRYMCPDLQFFVAFSSITSGRGNAGQTNYGYANSVMEQICELRRANGLPALAIQWGAVADVGVIAEIFKDTPTQSMGGTVPQRINSCLSLMNHFLRSSDSVITSLLRFETKVAKSGQQKGVIGLICGILGLKDSSKVRPQSKLSELGMDSLMVVEIKQSLEQEFHLILTLKQLSDMTFADIIKLN